MFTIGELVMVDVLRAGSEPELVAAHPELAGRSRHGAAGIWTRNGGAESACGWCLDCCGFSWQITPRALLDATTSTDRAAAKRAFEAMMTMKKIDVAAIEAAVRGETAHALAQWQCIRLVRRGDAGDGQDRRRIHAPDPSRLQLTFTCGRQHLDDEDRPHDCQHN